MPAVANCIRLSRASLRLALAAAMAVSLELPVQAPAAPREAPARAAASSALPHFSRIAVLVMENKEYTAVIGSKDAPYVNGLARRYALATSYHAIRHPSLPNYLALLGGETFGVRSDCSSCEVQSLNLVDQLQAAGISWKAYLENLPHTCYTRSSTHLYSKQHNPFAYFRNIVTSHSRCRRMVGFRSLHRDLRAGKLPRFSWITPNVCHDMHSCPVSTGDAFLSKLVPRVLKALGPRGVLFITWDEGWSRSVCCRYGKGGRVATIVAGGPVKRGFRSTIPYDHYSLLQTIEKAWGRHLLHKARCNCTHAMREFFA